MHPRCVYCGLPVWEVEPLIGRQFQGRLVAKGWLHFDCPEDPPTIVDDKVYREERLWPADGHKGTEADYVRD